MDSLHHWERLLDNFHNEGYRGKPVNWQWGYFSRLLKKP